MRCGVSKVTDRVPLLSVLLANCTMFGEPIDPVYEVPKRTWRTEGFAPLANRGLGHSVELLCRKRVQGIEEITVRVGTASDFKQELYLLRNPIRQRGFQDPIEPVGADQMLNRPIRGHGRECLHDAIGLKPVANRQLFESELSHKQPPAD